MCHIFRSLHQQSETANAKIYKCQRRYNVGILYEALAAMILDMSTYNDLNSNVPKMVSSVNFFIYEDFICVFLSDWCSNETATFKCHVADKHFYSPDNLLVIKQFETIPQNVCHVTNIQPTITKNTQKDDFAWMGS